MLHLKKIGNSLAGCQLPVANAGSQLIQMFMQQIYIPYGKIDYLSGSDKAYAQGDAALRPFYKSYVELDSFAQIIADKQQEATNRKVLHQVLKAQYSTIETTDSVL